jgi:hypothetical protein
MVGLCVGKGLSGGRKCRKGERTYKPGWHQSRWGFEVSAVGVAAAVSVMGLGFLAQAVH